jgi:hypothetical protein
VRKNARGTGLLTGRQSALDARGRSSLTPKRYSPAGIVPWSIQHSGATCAEARLPVVQQSLAISW